ncbi:response regulator transcription factor [Senegalimassilia anaerobia]
MIDMVIAEDQAMLRDSLACAIDMQDDMHVVAAIADAADALSAVEKHHANLALLDVCTENDSSGIVAAAAIKQARAAGVDSFVYKNVGTAELIAVIRSTIEGYSTFPRPQSNALSGAAALTQTEIDILRLVCETKTRKEIAQELYLSEGTVKRHISEILAKTGYDNILRLAVHAVASGLIIPGMGRTGEQSEE